MLLNLSPEKEEAIRVQFGLEKPIRSESQLGSKTQPDSLQ